MGFMEGRRSRVVGCAVLFGVFGWGMVELAELTRLDSSSLSPSSVPHRFSRDSRRLLSGFICAFFGLFLAILAEFNRSSIETEPPEPPVDLNVYCSICMEWKPPLETFDMIFCLHSFCKSCIGQYVETKVGENSVSIVCPDPDCKEGVLDPDLCQLVISPEVIARWERMVCEKAIQSKFYCPFRDCSAVLADERDNGQLEIRQAECPHCRRLFCAKCEVPWHAELSCEEFQKLGKDERGREDLLVVKMAKTEQWQRCPKCKFYVEKTHGCMFIKCRCKFVFCYRCGTEMIKDHYCDKCKK